MVKYWNNNPRHGERPVKPSFLIEVMALQCLYGGWQGRFDYEIQAFFSTLADRILEFGRIRRAGADVSDCMDAARKQRARELLTAASREATLAIDHVRRGRNGEALKVWRALWAEVSVVLGGCRWRRRYRSLARRQLPGTYLLGECAEPALAGLLRRRGHVRGERAESLRRCCCPLRSASAALRPRARLGRVPPSQMARRIRRPFWVRGSRAPRVHWGG